MLFQWWIKFKLLIQSDVQVTFFFILFMYYHLAILMYLQFIVVLIILAENHGIYSGKWLISLRSLSGFKIPHESFSGPLWGSTKPVQPPPPGSNLKMVLLWSWSNQLVVSNEQSSSNGVRVTLYGRPHVSSTKTIQALRTQQRTWPFFFAVCHDHVYTLAAPNNIYDGTSICTVPSIEIHYFAKLCVLCSLLCAYAADTIGKTFELPCLFDKS